MVDFDRVSSISSPRPYFLAQGSRPGVYVYRRLYEGQQVRASMYVFMYGMVWYGMVWYGMVWYGCTQARMRACRHVRCFYVCVCIYIYVCMCACVRACVQFFICNGVFVCMCICVAVHYDACACMCITLTMYVQAKHLPGQETTVEVLACRAASFPLQTHLNPKPGEVQVLSHTPSVYANQLSRPQDEPHDIEAFTIPTWTAQTLVAETLDT